MCVAFSARSGYAIETHAVVELNASANRQHSGSKPIHEYEQEISQSHTAE